jgi:hypothetical protein
MFIGNKNLKFIKLKMTESEIQKFKETLQNKLSTLAPKKIKGTTKVEVIDVVFEENSLEGYPGSMDITIEVEYDHTDISPYDTQWITKIKKFTKNLTTALLQNDTRVYVFFR